MGKRFLFVGSLPTKRFYFDGERNKSKDVLNALKRSYGRKCAIINLSLNQIWQVTKLIFLSFFVRYDFLFVSKCLVGGSKAIDLIMRFANRRNKNRVIFYLIGNGSNGFDGKKIYYGSLNKAKALIVESVPVKDEMKKKTVLSPDRIFIIPCVKPDYELAPISHSYPRTILKLLYFSRVTESKGLMDIIDAVIRINEEAKAVLFTLDIAGGSGDDEVEKAFCQRVVTISEEREYIHYLGLSLKADGLESYKRIQEYDLHVFPSRFYQECAPGSIIDMFIAGVPTLSSDFPSAHYLMSFDESFFFESGNVNDLILQLREIYNHQEPLNSKRVACHQKAAAYGEQAFIDQMKGIVGLLEE